MDADFGEEELLVILHKIMNECVLFFCCVMLYKVRRRRRRPNALPAMHRKEYSLISKVPGQIKHLKAILEGDDESCKDFLRMNRAAFDQLCKILTQFGGLRNNRNTSVSEQLAMFLVIIAHHHKIRTVKRECKRSNRTVSKNFHAVLNAIIKVHKMLLATPDPVSDDCTDARWMLFKGCLGALDGTYIPVRVAKLDRPRYRTRKGKVAVNVLGVCNRDMNFTYVLTGWEGSAADARVLRDAVTRPNGLKVPPDCLYLCDNGYTNGPEFLTPYRGCRYHLDEWGHGRSAPQNKEEYFNMKHCRARNVIERAFGLLKMRWAILRSASYYPVRAHNRIIMACCLLQNYIRTTMDEDPMEHELENVNFGVDEEDFENFIDSVEPTPQWTAWREDLASSMFNSWMDTM